jgi:hypothetical protein
MTMRGPPPAPLALAMVALAACSDGGSGGPDGGGGMGGSVEKSCVDIRRCTVESQCLDQTCVSTCKQGGSAAAQAAFDSLEQCMLGPGGCARNSPDFKECFCLAQCREEFTCETELFACLAETAVDQVCDICF